MKKVLVLRAYRDEANEITLEPILNQLLEAQEISFTRSYYDDLMISFLGSKVEIYVNDVNILDYDLVYFKSWHRNQGLATTIALHLKHNDKKFLDVGVSYPRYGGKILQYLLLSQHGVDIPKTLYVSPKMVARLDETIKVLGDRYIVKSSNSRKGENNYLIDSVAGVKEIILNNPDIQFVVQEFIPNNYDYRVLVMGNKARIIEQRTRQDKSTHLNNVAGGASEEFLKLEDYPEVVEIAEKIGTLFGQNIYGADIVVSSATNKPYILEVNASPGMTYNLNTSPELPALANYFSELLK